MNKIKLISLLAAAAVMTGSVAMAETYSATGNGYHGEMTVNVTIEDGKITDVELGDNHETNVVIDRAFPVIRERILEANTADVDSVTAATFSSYAIKTAVADAMQQAGLEAPKVAMQNAEKTATERAAESCDIVIVGGGPAGLAAAVSAKQTNADKNVILVEKLDILSGNGKFDMNFFDMINTEAQKAAGNDEWVGEAGLAKFLEEKSSNGESAERIQVWANEEYNLDAWLRAMGVELNYNYGGTNHMAEDNQYSGEVIQAGTDQSAAHFNNMESGIIDASVAAAMLLIAAGELQSQTEIERHVVELKNTASYPFNNSAKTVSLAITRDNTDYTVDVDIQAHTGNVGEIQIYDKQLNGFKVKYDGSAESATLILRIKGGK